MRWLLMFSIGFAVACGLGAYLPGCLWMLPVGILCGILALLCVANRKRAKAFLVAAVALLGCGVGLLWSFLFDLYYLEPIRAMDGDTAFVEAEILDYSIETDFGIAADSRVQLNGRDYRMRIYLPENQNLLPGDRIQAEIRFRYTSIGGEQEPTYHPGDGIFLLGYVDEDYTLIHSGKVSWRAYPARLRYRIGMLLQESFPEETLAFAKALLLGDTTGLDYETDTALKISGIRHVAAVSGLHVSILFGLLYHLIGRRRTLVALIGLPTLLLFAAVAGFTPSVNRAAVMQALMILATLLDREYDPPTALGFSVLLMVAVNPYAITSVSLQLSAGCMAGIFLFSDKIHGYLMHEKRLGPAKGKGWKAQFLRWIAGSVSVSVSTMLVTTPLSAYYFGTVSLIGIVTNLLTIWLISFIFYGIMLAGAAAAIWLPLGKGVAWLISWPIRYVLAVAKGLSRLPVSAVYTCSEYITLWLLFAYGVLGLFLIMKNRKPLLTVCTILTGLALAVGLSYLEPRLDPLRVTVLDVGQGQCILLQTADGNYMVDCGGDSDAGAADKAAQLLLSQGILRLDGLILTHYDRDHAGGAEMLLTRIEADCLYLPDIPDKREVRENLTNLCGERICWIREDTTVGNGDTRITLLTGNLEEDSNESGICVLFQAQNCDILITGDYSSRGERALLASGAVPDLELLVVGHHGSGSATCMELLAAASPEYAVISVGRGNPYGHPADEVLKRLYLHVCEVSRTDLDGDVVFRR